MRAEAEVKTAWAPGEEPLALERNLALLAGAGAGKTYSLITICLHLLGGARRDGVPLRAHELFLLTFTDKAAAEMRERLRARVDRLARDGGALAEEKALSASYEKHGRVPPPQDFWRKVRDDLGAATIGTFHSLCVQLLRRAPAGAGVDPAFELLEEREAQALLQDAAERVVLGVLEEDGDDAVSDLCRDLRFVGQGRSEGLVDHLCTVFTRVREEGVRPSGVSVGDFETARAEFDAAVKRYQVTVQTATEADAAGKKRFGEVLTRVARAADGLTFENFLEPTRWPLIRDTLRAERGLSNAAKDVKPAKFQALGKKDKDDHEVGLCGRYAACLAAKQEAAFRELLVRLEARHTAELHKRGALDFTALLIKARDLLRDQPAFRREVQDRLRALLVDEFQDTNRLQLELVTLLAEKREGAPRFVVDGAEGDAGPEAGQLGLAGLDERKGRGIAVSEVPLEPGMLAAVGDRKQSIYEFRGADVSVFEVLAKQIERDGGARHFLQDNRRSSPQLISWFNDAFAGVMGPKAQARDYEVAWDAGADALRAVRPSVRPHGEPAVERLVYTPLETSEECRLQDADAVARYLAHLLSPGGAQVVVDREGGGAPRRARGGDVAILFRRFTYLEAYRQALVRHGVPHRVVRGRGFYGAQEVMDLASLLGLLADPRDALSLAAVVRSPLVALSDASLFQLAWASGRRLSFEDLRDEEKQALLPEDERARLLRFVRLFPALRRERDRLGVRVLLEVALEETGFRAAMAGTPYGEQALANISKLLELAARRDAEGSGDAAGFARELLALAEAEPDEAQADVLDAGDPRAVQLLTIHRAKGLEWPVVVVPDLASKRRPSGGRVVFDRRLGLSVKPWLADELEPTNTARYLGICAERARREEAEAARTLYVALTRARDALVLSGQSAKPVSGSWRQTLDALIEERPELKEATRDVFVEQIPPPAPSASAPALAEAEAKARAEAAIARARQSAKPKPQRLVLPVTALGDFFLCPRRYLYAHEVGLSEHPMVFEVSLDEAAGEAGGARADPRVRGTLAHKLLEVADLAEVQKGGASLRAHLEALLWREGERAADKGTRELLEEVEAFMSTRFFGQLAKAGPARVHRELPFLLRLPEVDGLSLHVKGKIDLLFEEADGGALVLDYKFSRRHPGGLAPYQFQLDCYALAARQLVKDGVPIRAGIAFLREGKAEPEIRSAGEAKDAEAFAEELARAGRQLVEASFAFEWPGREQEVCKSLRCGYQYRCHPSR